jgi:phosphatidylglycerophosphate synthase
MSARTDLQLGIYKVINPFVRLLIKLGLTPNAVTTIGLVLNIGVAAIFIKGAERGHRGDLSYVGWAGALVLFAGLFDMLDGQVARLGNMSSRFGALYDSVLDRYSEMVLFLGICYYLVAHHYFLSSLFAFIALIGSMMVSYTRARAEGLGIECKDGLMQRPERVILIGITAIACGVTAHYIGGDYKLYVKGFRYHVFETMTVFTLPITFMAVMTNITAIGRLMGAKKTMDMKEALEKEQQQQQTTKIISTNITSKIVSFIVLCLVTAGAYAEGNPQDTFPVPPRGAEHLFYLQRTPNANTIMYELNYKDGVLDTEEPIHVFWIRYTEQRQKQDLSYIQRKFAYGVKAKDLGNGKYELHFVSYKKMPLYLERSPVDKMYHVYATVGNKYMRINRIFIYINGGSMFSPNIEYVEVKGADPVNGKEIVERIKI